MKKRHLSMLLGVALVFALFTGTAPTAAAEGDPVEISIALWEIDPSFINKDDAVYNLLCDKFNITIKPIPMTWDDYTEKVNTWVATDDMPDMFNIDALGKKSFSAWVRDELVRALPDDLSPYPNLQKLFSLPDVEATAVNGRYYNIPRAKADMSGLELVAQGGCYYRKDWAEKLGLKEPTTVDEYIEFVRAMINGDPDGNGIDDTVGITSYDSHFMCAFLWRAIEPRAFGSWQLDENGNGYIAYNAEHTFDAANTIRQMYNEGLIDPDIAIQDTDAGFVKFATNKAAILPFQMYQNDHYIFDKFLANNPDKSIEDCIGYLKPLENKYDGKYYYNVGLSYWSESYISYKVDDVKFERILQLLNFCAGDEYLDIVRYGLEGEDYTRDAEGNVVFLTEDGKRPNLLQKYTFLNGFKFLTLWDEGQSFFDFGTNYPYSAQMVNEFYDWAVANGTPQPACFVFDAILTPAREAYVDEAGDLLNRFMFSKSDGDPEEEWAAMQATIEANGLSVMVEEMNQAARDLGLLQ